MATIDATANNPANTAAVVDNGVDNMFADMENQPTLLAEMETFYASFEASEIDGFANLDTNRGRIVDARWARTSAGSLASALFHRLARPASRAIPRPQVLAIVRARWQIENSPHWVLDATFKEDQSRPRKGRGAANIEASFRTVHAVSPGCVLRHYDCFQPRPVVAFPEPRDIGTNPYAARFKTAMYFMDGLMLIDDGLFKLARFLRPKEKFNILPQRSLITLHGENIIGKRLELRFQSLSLEIATRHSSHGAKCGERIGPVEDA